MTHDCPIHGPIHRKLADQFRETTRAMVDAVHLHDTQLVAELEGRRKLLSSKMLDVVAQHNLSAS